MTGISEALGNGHSYTRAKFIRGWQDLCAMHDLRASDGENAPWRQDVRAAYSPTALCGSFWTHSTHILPKLAVSEYMQAICCHEPVFSPSEAPSGTHRGDTLPWPAAWERIKTIYCRGQEPGGARHGACRQQGRSSGAQGGAGAGRGTGRTEAAGRRGRASSRSGGGGSGRSCRRRAKLRVEPELRRAGGMYGAAASAGDRHPQRESRGRRRMARFPHQSKESRPTPSSPKQKKASALLAFFCCSVYDSNDPRDLHGNKPLPFGILSDRGLRSAAGLHPRQTRRSSISARRPSRTLTKPSS